MQDLNAPPAKLTALIIFAAKQLTMNMAHQREIKSEVFVTVLLQRLVVDCLRCAEVICNFQI